MGMKIKLSAHGAYHHQYHVVWIPKYRKKVLKGELKQYLEKGLFDIERFHPDIEIETLSIQVDHIHLVIVIPPKYAVSDIVGKIKANTSRGIRKRFPWIKKIWVCPTFYIHNASTISGPFSRKSAMSRERYLIA